MAVKKFCDLFIIIQKSAFTCRDAKFLARSPSARVPVVARHVKGVFVDRRYKKRGTFCAKNGINKKGG